MRTARSWTALTVLSAALIAPLPAFAQVTRSGPTFRIGGSTAPVMLPDVAFDSTHDRYLVVTGNGFIEAQVLDAAGHRIAAVPIHVPAIYSQTPRVAFSPHINGGHGGYLVTWHETHGAFTQVWGKMLSHDGAALTGPIVISPEGVAAGTGSHWLAGAAIAYSAQSREFLVTYMGGFQTVQDIRFNRVSVAGQVLQAPAAITGGLDLEREPSVAYNPARNEFYIVYMGFTEAGGFGWISGQRIQAGTGAVLGSPTMFIQTAAAQIPHVEYNPATGNYIVVWFNRTRTASAFYGIAVRGSDGAIASEVRLVSSRYFAYDALDFSYNAQTNDFVLVTHGSDPQCWEDAAIQLRADGTPYDNGILLTATTDVRPLRPDPNPATVCNEDEGNFNPRVVSSGASGRYLAVTSSGFAAIHGQFASSTGGGGGGGGCPPHCQPDPRMALDVPGAGNVSGQFAVAGWALDRGAPSGTGVDQVHVWAFNSTNGASTFVGAANLGVSRPDIGAWLGAQFSPSGFGMTGSLAAGTYDINAYARSTVTGLFMAGQARRITVVAPVSQPMLFADFPAQNQTVAQFFTVAGWAVDRASSSGPGVSGIHVWAFPASGGDPIFVGSTTTGHQRPDVAAYLAHPRFGPSGYILQGNLPPGQYNLVVFAWSDVAGGFNQWVPISIRVV